MRTAGCSACAFSFLFLLSWPPVSLSFLLSISLVLSACFSVLLSRRNLFANPKIVQISDSGQVCSCRCTHGTDAHENRRAGRTALLETAVRCHVGRLLNEACALVPSVSTALSSSSFCYDLTVLREVRCTSETVISPPIHAWFTAF